MEIRDLVYSLSKRFTFRMDPDDDIEDVVSERVLKIETHFPGEQN